MIDEEQVTIHIARQQQRSSHTKKIIKARYIKRVVIVYNISAQLCEQRTRAPVFVVRRHKEITKYDRNNKAKTLLCLDKRKYGSNNGNNY